MESDMLKESEEPPEPLPSRPPLSPIDALLKEDQIIQKLWPGVTPEQWNNWRWQMANSVKTLDALETLLSLKPYQISKYKRLLELYRYTITPYYLSLIDWFNPEDPIRRQCVPDLQELDYLVVGNRDPLEEEEDMQVPGLVHRYPDRVLAVVTNACSLYCRHCTRKRIWHEGEGSRSKLELLKMLEYIRATPEIREVIISGGDPLVMNIELLDWFLGELQRLEHVEVLRIGTRVPAVLPMRVTDELVGMLAKHRPLWINTQFNHPREITPEAQEACDKLLKAGIPLSNQSVLLRGVNDNVAVMKKLCHELQRIMVRPYYLYQCDPVKGVEHFRTSVWKGIEIIETMRGYTGGLCIPTFVVDAPGGGGKIPLQPFYLLSATDKDVLLRNYEGMIIKYYNPQEVEFAKSRRAAEVEKEGGTAQVIVNGKALVPEATPRYRRRRQKKALLKLDGNG